MLVLYVVHYISVIEICQYFLYNVLVIVTINKLLQNNVQVILINCYNTMFELLTNILEDGIIKFECEIIVN